MAEKSQSVLRGSNLLLFAGVLAVGGAIVYLFASGREEVDAVADALKDESAVVQDDAQAEAAPKPVTEPTTATTDATEDNTPVETAENAEEEPSISVPDTEEAAVDDAPTEEEVASDAAQETAPPVAPSFDLVRIDPEGGAVIAGRAEPGGAVRLLADGNVVAETVADASGKFVALFDLPPSETPRSLSAEVDGASGVAIASTGTVLIAPTRPAVEVAEIEEVEEAPELEVASLAPQPEELPNASAPATVPNVAVDAVAAEPTLETSETTDAIAVVDAEAGDVPEVDATATASVETPPAADEAASEPTVVAEETPQEPAIVDSPAVVLADEQGVTVLQPAPRPNVQSDGSPEVVANLVIDTITYDTEGDVALGGRGAAQSFARIYVDDRPVETVPIAPDGSWESGLPDIDAGVYRLRIDEVTADGTVTSRVETPFQREAPEVAAEAIQRPNAVTVQEGFTLWAIAKDRFGSGFEYVRVYEANRNLIRDPDLIYPGQVFEIPEG